MVVTEWWSSGEDEGGIENNYSRHDMRHDRTWTLRKDTQWKTTINTQSQYETALSSPGVDSVTEGPAIYPVPLLGTLL